MTGPVSASWNWAVPRTPSACDVARAFEEALCCPVEPAFVPPEAHAAVLAEAGLPIEVATALRGLYAGLASGRVAREVGTEHWRGAVLPAAIGRMVESLRTAA